MNIIDAQDLRFRYPAAEEEQPAEYVLNGVSIQVKAGEFLAVLGHNGSGKSTFAKHLNAILLPEGGTVYVDGKDTRDENNLLAIRETAGMVFQNPDNQLVATIVEEDVAFAPENLGVAPEEIARRVDAALQTVGMTEFRFHAPHLLSGGQKQRIAIAGVLAMEPRCLVMDEPTAMLDPIGRREVMNTVLQLNREKGITVVLITHHMEEAALAHRVVVMDGGRVVLEGTPKEVFSQPETMRSVRLTVPQTVEVMEKLDAGLDLRALSVEECADQLMKYLEK